MEWSDARFEGTLFFHSGGGASISKVGDQALMWMSEKGVCYGGKGGKFYNLTAEKIDILPKGLTGSGLVYKDKFIGLIDP